MKEDIDTAISEIALLVSLYNRHQNEGIQILNELKDALALVGRAYGTILKAEDYIHMVYYPIVGAMLHTELKEKRTTFSIDSMLQVLPFSYDEINSYLVRLGKLGYANLIAYDIWRLSNNRSWIKHYGESSIIIPE